MDNKQERFEKVAETRVRKVLHDLALLGSMAGSDAYRYTPAHVEQMFSAIDRTSSLIRKKFSARTQEADLENFSFALEEDKE
ncbi:hypothetical protein [Acidaminococcus sp. HCP3S3_G9_1]|uniref:hypothetical protein n=1 Tax=Acidaminococcus sp. HCP3S3_G9_1 TaxID=3438732 RepID=UPI003F909F6E